jgi:SAM-dependent methyltransferase
MPSFEHLPEGPRMIELGAGLGRFTAEFSSRCKHVTAVDFIDTLIQQNKRANGHLPNVDFVCADATKLVLPPSAVDYVFSNWCVIVFLAARDIAAAPRRHRAVVRRAAVLSHSSYFLLANVCTTCVHRRHCACWTPLRAFRVRDVEVAVVRVASAFRRTSAFRTACHTQNFHSRARVRAWRGAGC